ncbi:MAG: LPS export ABC transporter periplasmic protein LptC [Desulfofustis sp.]|jgi:LPS export ABC transporter protein LptC
MITLNRRNLVWLIPTLLIVTFPLWRLPVGSFLAPRATDDTTITTMDEDRHDFVMQKVTIAQNQAGKKTAEIRSWQAYTGDKPEQYVLVGVDADLFDDQGNRVNVKADSGIYNTLTKHLILSNNVVVDRVGRNQKLYTDLLHYYEDKRVIDSPAATEMVAENARINGSSLHYDIVTGQYLIGGRVHCVLGTD